MELKIIQLKPKTEHYMQMREIMDTALKEILQEVLIYDWEKFKNMKGMEIISDIRFHNLMTKRKYNVYK